MAERKQSKKQQPMTKEEIMDKALHDIRTKFGQGAIMQMGDQKIADINVIPTGVLPVDAALTIGGLPRGRITEIFGPEGTGKTTLALHTIAEAQKAGGTAAYIDAEHALDPRLAMALGVKIETLYLSQPDSGEQALYILETLIKTGAVDIIVVDSVAALTPQAEIDGSIESSPLGLQARLMSYGLRRITAAIAHSQCVVVFINQLRANISTSYGKNSGPSETTSGGRALKFYTSVRLEVRRGKTIIRKEEAIGHELYIKVVKNKLAPPFRTAHCSLMYGKGIPLITSIVDMAIDSGVLKRKGSWLTYKGDTIAQGKDKMADHLEKNPELLEEIRQKVLEEAASGTTLFNIKEDAPGSDDDSSAGDSGVNIEDEVIEMDISDDSIK